MSQRNAAMWERRDDLKRYLQLARKAGTRALSTDALADSAYPYSRSTIAQDLRDMAANGEVRKIGRSEWEAP